MLICLDPGHGGNDRANRGPTGYVEADGVLDIALRARPLLRAAGLGVMLTRERDLTLSLATRTKLVLTQKADIFVSIHTDAFSDPSAMGCTVFYGARDPLSKKLAAAIEKELRLMGRPSRGIKTRLLANGRDYYHVIRETDMPAVLVECAFHTNPAEEALLKTDSFRQLLATAIAGGIKTYHEESMPRQFDPAEPEAIPVFLDGKLFPIKGRLWDNTTFMPVRALAEALGFFVYWDEKQRQVRLISSK